MPSVHPNPVLPQTPASTDPYADPFRNATVTPERVDMGVDFSGTGPIYALGPGIITEADNAWSGAVGAPFPGTFITEKLTAGSLKGKYIYYAEDINPNVSVGDIVDSNTVIGTFTGGDQLETGFAVGPSMPGTTLAMAQGQSATGGDPGAFPTAYGEAYNQVLTNTGAPAGIINSTPVGKLPKNWPGPGTPSGTQQATLTSFNPLNPLTWFGSSLFSANLWERIGLVIFGAILIIVGIWLLAGKQAIKIVAPEAGAAASAVDA